MNPAIAGQAVLKLLLLVATGLLAIGVATPALAQAGGSVAPPQFTSRAEAERFHALTEQLRCVKCQNQSLADSNAAIAQDLREEVLQLMRQGKTNDEIKLYLVARYGEFVLYRPRLEPSTWLLWFGPALLLLAGGLVVAVIVRKRGGRKSLSGNIDADDEQEW